MSAMTISEFADNLNKILPMIMKEFSRRLGSEFNTGKVTLPQFLIVQFLHQERVMRMTDLARYMRVTTAAMTGIVDRLLKSGYVAREYDSKDRRTIRVILTSKGTELFKKVNQQRQQMIIDIFGQISRQDRSNYLRILTQIKDILNKKSGD
ncbi:MAG: MarR family transcriptional regulator [Candidatus Omnitrophota bacterium]|nr:MarR family transcriptional regulator [Candidatus Omnitrophota bacterium]MBU1928660.1 MarR family transcriptional regulator [Candidatus Omnitrophota bacterium]MBU2035775.1 MarR family transcriptional regulator [Candidatus Omnitrophota bacterium]MBU2222101.1 MarR family transcriptional regulator [Candidatus Omnitrophota bacterium]MBU2258335.1 MarR family transcriptional regulator [Candidatus Omnitrophota bacterium]